ncbi:ShlB/FhaC/HecB family hemolysin secretion/activation protein [Allopusillimonas soli]|uniref:ShlB/FhaC/HecB family hemolysin secretion/activation protein n=2 Tax=Allopusillimonas soli TaxID=659016 RepID=A0A853FD72_9BURK|nr:ShlB/FhaC/HecB family hemolysin secretion/activation protein [Allopusillimonas soli]TEA70220.1 ShlB/FhaC/HecB family hemolysin secretion/activation protein [Allopusillimonas soli]
MSTATAISSYVFCRVVSFLNTTHIRRKFCAWALAAGVILLPAAPVLADGVVRGNPIDSLPKLQVPGETQKRPAQVQIQKSDAQRQIERRMAQRIIPRHFTVSGNTVVPLSDIIPILEPLAGKETTVGALVQEVNKITAIYQSRGYALSFALLQNQSFANGLVKVTVVEGHVSRLRIEGDVGNAGDRLQSLAAPIVAEKPLTRKTFERQLNLMRQVPGVSFTPKLDMPRRADGATEFVIDAQRQRVSLSGGIADLGTGMQGMVGVTLNSLTPLGEQIKLTSAPPLQNDDVEYYAYQATVPVGNKGLALESDGYYYLSEPHDALLESQGWDRRVENKKIGIGVSYPFILNNERMLKGKLSVYAAATKDQYHRDVDNAWLKQSTDLRVARAELRYRDVGPVQSRDITLGVNKGFDAWGASKKVESNYATFADPSYELDFVRYTLDARQTFRLPHNFGITLSAAGQYSSDILPNFEQISFGAWHYGLGYEQGELAGDKGYGMSLELNKRIPTGWGVLSAIQPYVMYDHARAWYNDDNLKSYNGRKLSSAALGVRLTDDKHYVFDFNVAKPMGDLPLNSDDRSLRFNANYSLLYDGM